MVIHMAISKKWSSFNSVPLNDFTDSDLLNGLHNNDNANFNLSDLSTHIIQKINDNTNLTSFLTQQQIEELINNKISTFISQTQIEELINTALSNYISSIPIATDTVLGGIKVGPGLTIDSDGVLSVNSSYFVETTSIDAIFTNPIRYDNSSGWFVGIIKFDKAFNDIFQEILSLSSEQPNRFNIASDYPTFFSVGTYEYYYDDAYWDSNVQKTPGVLFTRDNTTLYEVPFASYVQFYDRSDGTATIRLSPDSSIAQTYFDNLIMQNDKVIIEKTV